MGYYRFSNSVVLSLPVLDSIKCSLENWKGVIFMFTEFNRGKQEAERKQLKSHEALLSSRLATLLLRMSNAAVSLRTNDSPNLGIHFFVNHPAS